MVYLTDRAEGKLDGVPTSIMVTSGMPGLFSFFLQRLHEDDNPSNIANYGNPNLTEYQAIHNHTYEAYHTVSTILSLYRSIYRKLIKDLSN